MDRTRLCLRLHLPAVYLVRRIILLQWRHIYVHPVGRRRRLGHVTQVAFVCVEQRNCWDRDGDKDGEKEKEKEERENFSGRGADAGVIESINWRWPVSFVFFLQDATSLFYRQILPPMHPHVARILRTHQHLPFQRHVLWFVQRTLVQQLAHFLVRHREDLKARHGCVW